MAGARMMSGEKSKSARISSSRTITGACTVDSEWRPALSGGLSACERMIRAELRQRRMRYEAPPLPWRPRPAPVGRELEGHRMQALRAGHADAGHAAACAGGIGVPIGSSDPAVAAWRHYHAHGPADRAARGQDPGGEAVRDRIRSVAPRDRVAVEKWLSGKDG